MSRHHESPVRRTNPSGEEVWVARYTNRDGKYKSAGTYKLKRDAQDAIDKAYEREYGTAVTRDVTVADYHGSWLRRHPRTRRTNENYDGRVRAILDVEIEGVKVRDWPMAEFRRRHALDLLDHMLREQGRAARGAQGILRVLSAMWQDAIDDERADHNPVMGVKVHHDDPRIQKAARRVRVWSWEDMHRFARAAGKWEPMVRTISDCWLRIGEVFPLERGDLARDGCSGPDCRVEGPHLPWSGRRGAE